MSSNILKFGALAIILVGFTFLSFQYSRQPAVEAIQPQTQVIAGVPVRIQIPSIRVDAAIESVALAADGTMDVPTTPAHTAWYNLGPRPGEIGNAVIDGHVDWADGSRAVFADLRGLKPGDKVTVQDDQGTEILFVVRESRRFDPNAGATEVFTSNDGRAHLNLITCDGVWDKIAKQYSERLVVFTDKE